jgi:predicted alpha/beta hydrolase
MTTRVLSPQTVTVQALDGRSLTGSLFEPDGSPRAALLVSSGTGIPRRFYGRFAAHAADRGFAALTYDFRGVGDSAPSSLRDDEARYRDWGQQDIPGIIDWLTQRYPDLPLYTVGHSTGGQQLGLAPNVDRVQAAVFVAVSTGYWGGMPPLYQILTFAIFRLYVPLTAPLYGYAPAKKIGWGEDLPTNVAREWGAWCQEPDYMAAFFDESGRRSPPDGAAFGPTHFDRARFPIRGYYFPDDPIATPDNVPPMLSLYDRAEIETRWVDPADLYVSIVGHLGFFRSDVGQPLWDEALGWLAQQA